MEKIIQELTSDNEKSLKDLYIYRNGLTPVISSEDPANNSDIVNKFNKKDLYFVESSKDVLDNLGNANATLFNGKLPVSFFNKDEFPELFNKPIEVALTNDGILVIRSDNSHCVIYDLISRGNTDFSALVTKVSERNNDELKKISADALAKYHYLLSFDNEGFIPIKISNNLFYLDCESCKSIDGYEYEKTNEGYFKVKDPGRFPEHIKTIKILNKTLYNIKVYNDKSGDILDGNGNEITANNLKISNEELTLKAKNAKETIVIELW